jgi:pimeloyl-ACP methyl ester carboxylesterase
VAVAKLRREGVIAYREAVPEGEATGEPVVCVHGFPESSRMWVLLMEALGDAGRRALAPDLYALGDSPDFGPATFENSLERFSEWVDALRLGRVGLVVHDWGGFVGLAWACSNPDRVDSLVVSNTGFFADGKWHGMAKLLRSEQGEEIIGALDRGGFDAMMNSNGEVFSAEDLDAYWAPFDQAAGGRGQRATLEFYRSMDMEKLEPWQGKLAKLGAPALLVWGADDSFAPLAGAKRFEREIPGAKLLAIEGGGHFIFDEQRERAVAEAVAFLTAAG